MANKILGGSFTLTAIVDGKNYTALVVNRTSTALAQFVSPSGEVTPNWKSSNPKVAMVVYDQDGYEISGSSIQNLKMIYNGSPVVAGQSFPNITYLPSEGAVKFNDNVASLENANDDSFVLEGEITVAGGVNITLRTAPQTIQIIQTASGTAYLCLVEGKNISGDMVETTLTATIIDHTGTKINNEGWNFRWLRVEGDQEVEIETGQSNALKISSDMVNGFQLFKCEASKDGAEAEAGYCQIKDDTDPYYIGIVQEGVSGDRISEGQTAIYKATIVDKNGDAANGFDLEPSWSITNSLGEIQGTDKYTLATTKWTNDTVKLTYAQTLAMGTAYGYVSGVITKAT